MGRDIRGTNYLLYLAVLVILIAIVLAIFQRYVASLISLGCAIVLMSLLNSGCRE
ncbi:MAG: hypothetical protein QXW05_07145 [Ignisphaera sp.]